MADFPQYEKRIGRRHFEQDGVHVRSAERCLRHGNRRFQQTPIPYSTGPAVTFYLQFMQNQNVVDA
jgi:hypothetical protein